MTSHQQLPTCIHCFGVHSNDKCPHQNQQPKASWDSLPKWEREFHEKFQFSTLNPGDSLVPLKAFISQAIDEAIQEERRRIKENIEGSVYALMYSEDPMPEFDTWREHVLPGLIHPKG